MFLVTEYFSEQLNYMIVDDNNSNARGAKVDETQKNADTNSNASGVIVGKEFDHPCFVISLNSFSCT